MQKYMKKLENTGIIEMIDFIKDIYYVVTQYHDNQLVIYLLWSSALFTVVFDIVEVSLMSNQTFFKLYYPTLLEN